MAMIRIACTRLTPQISRDILKAASDVRNSRGARISGTGEIQEVITTKLVWVEVRYVALGELHRSMTIFNKSSINI